MFCELFIPLSCGVRREYQDLLYNHRENQPLPPPPTSDVPPSFPMHRKENIKEGPLVDTSTSKGLRRSLRKTRVIIGDSDDENKSQCRSEGTEREVLIMPELDFGLRKKAKDNAFSPKFTGTLAWYFEDPLLLIYFGILISL